MAKAANAVTSLMAHGPAAASATAKEVTFPVLLTTESAPAVIRPTETMLELGREIALPLPVAQLADTAYQFTLELEEMYDLDSTWLIFTRFFRNIRKSLGIRTIQRSTRTGRLACPPRRGERAHPNRAGNRRSDHHWRHTGYSAHSPSCAYRTRFRINVVFPAFGYWRSRATGFASHCISFRTQQAQMAAEATLISTS